MFKKAILLLLAAAPALSSAQEGDWLVAPYFWASDVGWDLAARGSGGVSASDLVDKIEGAGMARIEYARNKIGFTFDYVGISLRDNRNISTPGQVPISIDISARLDLDILEFGAFYRPSATDSGLELMAGVRDTDVDSTLIVSPANLPTQTFDSSPGFTDVYLGARYLHRFNDSWDFTIRGDYGFGDSDGSVNFMAGAGWRSSGVFGLHLAYRHFEIEFDQTIDGERASSDVSLSGPMLGFLFRF